MAAVNDHLERIAPFGKMFRVGYHEKNHVMTIELSRDHEPFAQRFIYLDLNTDISVGMAHAFTVLEEIDLLRPYASEHFATRMAQ